MNVFVSVKKERKRGGKVRRRRRRRRERNDFREWFRRIEVD